MSEPDSADTTLRRMREEWDARARENARFYVATGQAAWDDDGFFASGEAEADHFIRSDFENICQGRDPKSMRALEIGCGAGRVTRALARIFGEVHGVDISGEMIERARGALAEEKNAFVYQNNGEDLTALPPVEFDFAFSMIVFQHIPSAAIVENYFREVNRVLRPGTLFKVQLQGKEPVAEDPPIEPGPLPLHWRLTGKIPLPIRERYLRPLRRAVMRAPEQAAPPPLDSWNGVTFGPAEAAAMADRTGFELRHQSGAGEQYYWLWCFKRG